LAKFAMRNNICH